MLKYNPDDRITASQGLKHPFFKELRELDKQKKEKFIQPSISPSGSTIYRHKAPEELS
jgi:serine/threonine protein kinase